MIQTMFIFSKIGYFAVKCFRLGCHGVAIPRVPVGLLLFKIFITVVG